MTEHPRPASLARRALPALAVLGASGAILTQLGGSSEAASLTTTPTAAPTTTVRPSTSAASARSSAAPTTTVRPGASAASAAPTTTARAGATAPATTAPASAGATCTGTTYTGAAFSNKYGEVQVAAVVSAAKKLCDVQVLVYPDGDRKSVSINQRALPTLRTEALAANGAKIAGVTGATLTSRGYEASLQSALDQAG
jgi:uncharacterized protein with FMN-binding domain